MLAFASESFGLALAGSSHVLAGFLVAQSCNGVASGILMPAFWAMTMRRAPADLMPRALGLVTTALYFGGTIAPAVLWPLRSLFGLRGQYLFAAATVAAGLVIAWLLTRLRGGRPDHDDFGLVQSKIMKRD